MAKSSYHLALFCVSDGERFTFEIHYDPKGNLTGVKDSREVKSAEVQNIRNYFDRISNRLYLVGLSKPISKELFLSKIEGLPFLNDLVRVETFNTDLTYGELRKRKMLLTPVVVSYHVKGIQLTF